MKAAASFFSSRQGTGFERQAALGTAENRRLIPAQMWQTFRRDMRSGQKSYKAR
jgi:hypothetical protein